MADPRREIRFVLNDEEIHLSEVGPGDTLLDFLRLDRRLCGTKEGCAEGDCGACTVLVGRRSGDEMTYEPVTSCIRLLPSLDGLHVATIESLRSESGLHPVQRAMVETHGSQCGFCTPGIVMALYAHWLQGGGADRDATETALQGNLCRCTGYAPILRAAEAAAQLSDPAEDSLRRNAPRTARRLAALEDGARVELTKGDERAILPANLEDLSKALVEHDAPTIVNGGTDAGLWVTKDQRSLSPAIFIGHLEALRQIEETPAGVSIGGAVTYADLEPIVARRWPWLLDYWRRIGGPQVRAMGAIGGNIANGSPIGDTPPPLIALGAEVELRSAAGVRTVPLETFFISYGQQDRRSEEFIEQIRIPDPAPGGLVAAYKISKRRDQDISSVSAGFQITVEGGVVRMARLAFGGMAGTPKRASLVEAALIGKPWGMASVEAAAEAMMQDFTPLSDWRASAAYRLSVARNLLKRFVLESQGAPDVRLSRRLIGGGG